MTVQTKAPIPRGVTRDVRRALEQLDDVWGITQIASTGSGQTITLTNAEARSALIRKTGNHSGSILVLPGWSKMWYVHNASTQSMTVRISPDTTGGSLAANKVAIVYSSGGSTVIVVLN